MGDDAEVLVVDARAEQISFEPGTTVDTTRPGATLALNDVPVHGITGADAPLLRDASTVLYCADSLGALSGARALITEHLVHRMAFERPLASFQVIQHRLANLAILEAACSALLRRASELLASPTADRADSIGATHSYLRPACSGGN